MRTELDRDSSPVPLSQDASVHGVPGLINLFGIASPGLTSSLAIAERVSSQIIRGHDERRTLAV